MTLNMVALDSINPIGLTNQLIFLSGPGQGNDYVF